MDHPRTLVLSPLKFNQRGGSGITMGNLFRGWPLDALAQIHSSATLPADEQVCTQYYYLSPWPPLRPQRLAMLLATLAQVWQCARGKQQTLGYWLNMEDLTEWCRSFRPDVLYVCPTESVSLYWWLPMVLAQRLSLPYVVHMMDDWPSGFEARMNRMKRLCLRPLLHKSLPLLLKNAAINIGISREMCMAYEQRYGGRFVQFHNCVDMQRWQTHTKSYAVPGAFRLVEVGHVQRNKNLGALQDIRDAVLTLRSQGHSISLHLYASDESRPVIEEHLAAPPAVIYEGYVPPAQLPMVLDQAALLILSVSFDHQTRLDVGYSLQTKVPEYMASGTPVLVYGPPGSPNVRYAARDGWGIIVAEPNQEQLQTVLLRLMRDESLRARMGKHARAIARRNHDAAVVRQQFAHLLTTVADQQDVTSLYNTLTGERRVGRG